MLSPAQTTILPEGMSVATGVGKTVKVIAPEVELAGVAHAPDGVRIQVTTLPLASEEDVYAGPVPTTVLPTCH